MGTGMDQVERIEEKSIGRGLSFGITHCNHIHHLQNYLEVEEKYSIKKRRKSINTYN